MDNGQQSQGQFDDLSSSLSITTPSSPQLLLLNADDNDDSNVPNFRLLLMNSRYDLIEKELMKMFNDRHQNRLDNRNNNQANCIHHHNHSLERSLFDIEEDLHKILLLLVKQLEVISTNHNHNNNHYRDGKNQDDESKIITKTIQPTMVIDRNKLKYNTHIHDRNHSMADCQKDFNRKNDQSSKKQSKILMANELKKHMPRLSSEYSKLCIESDERFHNKLKKIQSANEKHQQLPQHYRLTKSDIDLVLGSNDNNNNTTSAATVTAPSHSKFIQKQQQLAKLKQHNVLCDKIQELHDQQMQQQQQQQTYRTPQQIIKQIQNLIDELHLEHDWISKKLHYYQMRNEEILSENKTMAKMADRINLHNMQTLSEHLIHVMDHLYELHQLNKKNLRLILE